MTRTWIAGVALLVIVVAAGVGLGAYAYGMNVGQAQAFNERARILPERESQSALAGGSRNAPPANIISGQVQQLTDNTIELNTLTGVIVVTVNDQTQYQKTVPGSLTDIQPGERITIQCDHGADSSYTARFLQIGGGRMVLSGSGDN